jgi:hypothetical protein
MWESTPNNLPNRPAPALAGAVAFGAAATRSVTLEEEKHSPLAKFRPS